MCGIVAYLGHKEVLPVLIKGLKKLEYRGYDSAGIMLMGKGRKVHISKCVGKVADLETVLQKNEQYDCLMGIGHTRWATHGQPTYDNAHPHVSNSGAIHLVHNGIIENYAGIKKTLLNKGYTFSSDTDSEVLVNFIEEIKIAHRVNIIEALRIALPQVVGAYAIVVIDKERPYEMVVAKLGSPLAVGIGDKDFFVSSDPTSFLQYTKQCIYLNNNELSIISLRDGMRLQNLYHSIDLKPQIEDLKMDLAEVEKGDYSHYMLKEIFEQPQNIRDTLSGKIQLQDQIITISSVKDHLDKFKQAQRIIFISCGTSWHASLLGEYYIEELARIPVEVEYASEFRYRNPIIKPTDIIIPVSQSGETADTLAAIKMVKKHNTFLFGICNVVGSSIARETDAGMYTHAGTEIGVASTKAFSCQVSLLLLLALDLGRKIGTLDNHIYQLLLKELSKLPNFIQEVLTCKDRVKSLAKKYYQSTNFLYLARGCNFPIALEGALKLKELSYIHAEGYPAAEMKHGPIALIDENMPVVVVATKKKHYNKIVSNVMEIKARGGKIIAIVTKGDTQIASLADDLVEIPEVEEFISPILANIPLQLLSYYIAELKGCDIDQPRNLAKSVTVE